MDETFAVQIPELGHVRGTLSSRAAPHRQAVFPGGLLPLQTQHLSQHPPRAEAALMLLGGGSKLERAQIRHH